ncbi:MAG: cupin domain-containing protein [Verrucomicrobia bacterium]|nr:cupin domain-containing protein [Verrucomicrobiota bacterium]
MPVIRTSKKHLCAENRPEWCKVTSAGVFRVPTKTGTFDCHYHDFNEYWLVIKGKAKVMSEGKEYYVKPGDIVCTKAGDEHDVLEVYEDFEAFWFEEECPPAGREGHLHRTPEKARRRPIPTLPLPADFPG